MKVSITQDEHMNYVATVGEETKTFYYTGKSYGSNPARDWAHGAALAWVISKTRVRADD
jgi:hypothetical protein